jgi:hypothetical protein
MRFDTAGNERCRLTSDGKWLVGTSSSLQSGWGGQGSLQLASDSFTVGQIYSYNSAGTIDYGSYFELARARGTKASPSAVLAGDGVGEINFYGYSGGFLRSASIRSVIESGTISGTSMPGRLVFSTTADGASSPTERMRIRNDGTILIQQTALSSASDGCYFNAGTPANFHQLLCHSSSTSTLANLYLNRQASDGTLIDFRQADTSEGVISVSGTTVSLVGGHIARWSQLPNNGDPSELLKGTVMSNLDEMCEWGEEDNEQLNKSKVSDVEGDPHVAGVFVSTAFSDEGPLDFYLAMTGDMIIRIAEGVTVQRGDLLMSAGDGTAKPQDDDIVRSKTVAKVTSTHVTCTYDDGSYCVPCVLMAC